MFLLLVLFLYKVIIITPEQIFMLLMLYGHKTWPLLSKKLLKKEDASQLLFFCEADYKTYVELLDLPLKHVQWEETTLNLKKRKLRISEELTQWRMQVNKPY